MLLNEAETLIFKNVQVQVVKNDNVLWPSNVINEHKKLNVFKQLETTKSQVNFAHAHVPVWKVNLFPKRAWKPIILS